MKFNGRILLTAILAVSLWSCTKDNPVQPEQPAKEIPTYNLENPAVASFLNMAAATYRDDNWSTVSCVTDYCKNSATDRKDIPAPVNISWKAEAGKSYTLKVFRDKAMSDLETEVAGAFSTASIYNLIPGRTYYYYVTDKDGNMVKNGIFNTKGRVRMIKVSDTYSKERANNCRDLGGKKTVDGRTLKYCLIYRGSRMDKTTDGEKTYITGYMGVKTDVDLRYTDAYNPYSDAKWGVTYALTTYNSWDGSNKDINLTNPKNIKKTFSDIIGSVTAGRPCYIHCAVGADRTGYICMLTEAVLGVSAKDCSIDYELTSFSVVGTRDRMGKVKDYYFVPGMTYITGYKGSTFQEKATNILLDAGITQSQIDAFRSTMLE